jgi:hypothetical protein
MKNAKSRFRKYGNKKTTVDGLLFDSKLEAKRWQELKILERAGIITALQRQVTYRLEVNGQLICKYIADFEYSENGVVKTEDSKGYITPEFRLKAKLFKALFGREIIIVK